LAHHSSKKLTEFIEKGMAMLSRAMNLAWADYISKKKRGPK
jgi:hypothetical protein